MRLKNILFLLCLVSLLAGSLFPAGRADAATEFQATIEPAAKARVTLLRMTPEEKVGQLFLVTFKGRDLTSKDSKILDLVTNRFLGGVLLEAANDNFTGPVGAVDGTAGLTSDLQTARWDASQSPMTNPVTRLEMTPQYVPLFIGVAQGGDSAPYDQILNGVTVLPSEMAIGATWKPKLAEEIGSVMGQELQGLGINLYLGPNLDVMDNVQADSGIDPGTNIFGGDPYWVGEMGKAFISGLRDGGARKVAIIAEHFPGQGSADILPSDEVATVKKSLDQMKQTDLVPFFAVAANPVASDTYADGLLVPHIRYQGFQGNIRSSTKPLSFDQAAIDLAMAMPQFAPWRTAGGILVSDNLGSPSIRNFYDPTNTSFDARQVARNAFLAGNDLLLLDNFVATNDADASVTLQRTLEFFAQKYREDQAFAQRVDASVTRILTLKYRMYTNFTLANVLPAASVTAQIGQSQQAAFDVARTSVTLLSPSAAELSQTLPRAPELRDRLFFITDNQSARQCSQCPNQSTLAVDALQSAVTRLYGPQAGGQVLSNNLYSYSFQDVKLVLDNNKDAPAKLSDNLKQSDWVIFAMTSLQPARTEVATLRRLLTDQAALIRNKRVILFVFGAPYYLGATDISKLTAFYALYGKSPAFVEVAARILFQELVPVGDPPISVPGAGYDLNLVTSPDPAQVIELEIDSPTPAPSGTLTPQPSTTTRPPTSSVTPTPAARPKVGDTLPLRTGVILDHNQNPVPDGTAVRFLFTLGTGESSTQSQIEATTSQGVAKASFRVPNSGVLEIRVVADPAQSSKLLRLEISSSGTVAIERVSPTPLPSATPTITQTSTPSPTLTPTPTPTPVPPLHPGAGDWSLSVVLIWGFAGVVFVLGRRQINIRWGIRMAFLTAACGWAVYLYVALQLPGAQAWLDQTGRGGILLASLAGCLVGWLAGIIWWRQMTQRAQMPRQKRANGSM